MKCLISLLVNYGNQFFQAFYEYMDSALDQYELPAPTLTALPLTAAAN